jgi:ankyrin repeat protein
MPGTVHDQLWDAIKDEKEVERLLSEGADPNHAKIINGVKWFPLSYAVYYEYSGTVERLLAKGAKIREKDAKDSKELILPVIYKECNQWTLLAYSVWRNASRTITALLQHGADPNQLMPANYGSSLVGQYLLAFAMIEGQSETAIALINSPHIKLRGRNPLTIGDGQIGVSLSRAVGAGFYSPREVYTCSFLSYAVYYNQKDIALALLKKPAGSVDCDSTITIRGFYQDWPLISYVVYWGYSEIALGLLAKGVDPDKMMPSNVGGQPLLTYALTRNESSIAAAIATSLTQKGNNVENSILNIAAWESWKQIKKAVIQRESSDKKQETASLTNKPVAPIVTRSVTSDIKLIPSNLPANSREPKVSPPLNANKLTEAVFIALFADIYITSTDPKQDYRFSTVYKFMQMVITAWPEFSSLSKKLNLEKLEKKELNETSSGKIFIEFAWRQLLQAKSAHEKILFKQATEKELRKKWYFSLEKEEKQRELFQGQMQAMVKSYLLLSDEAAVLENIIQEIINVLKPKEALLKSNFEKERELVEFLKPLLKQIIGQDKRLQLTRLDEAQRKQLIEAVCKQLQLSIEDKEIKDIGQSRATIYKLRVCIGIWEGLYVLNQLSEEEKQIYELADKILNRLLQLRGRNEDSKRKTSIERMLIIEVLLQHSSKELILRHAALSTAKDTKAHEKLEFISYVAKKKHELEATKDRKVRDESYFGLSRDLNKQELYRNNIKRAVGDWLMHLNPSEPSISRHTISDSKLEPSFQIVFSPKQKIFINAFCRRFEMFYCMYIALDNNSVSRLQDHVDKFAKDMENYAHLKLNAMGLELPLGQLGLIVAKLAVYRTDRQVNNAKKRMGFVFSTRSMEENSRFIRFAAEYIAFRYEMQINRLSEVGAGIEVVGQCAAERAIQYITDSISHLAVQEPSLWDRAWQAITRFILDRKYDPDLMKEFKGPISVIIDGVIQGQSEKDTEKAVSTESGDTWVPGGIFRNVGFMVEDSKGGISLYRHPKLVTVSISDPDSKKHDHKKHGSLVYGYCRIRMEELDLAKKHGYVLDETPLTEIFKRFPKQPMQLEQQPLPIVNPLLPTATPTVASPLPALRG